ncbi:MAG: tRNA (guanosine(46)-N7)-methyltransferase TrmB [Lachnospiraceae bacterium]|nr:tRNA (guanosine(46)-N7)-methyltransferase TrmB [Lachnospiraceae bacterium]
MRLRNIPGAKEEMFVNPFVVQEPENKKGKWNEIYGAKRPFHIEIGTGKGGFITRLAALNPDVNYLGIEKYSSALIKAVRKREEMTDADNLFFLRFDAEYIPQIFAGGEIDRIYLNFSDPWPKDRHAKRRLTSTHFLAMYEELLSDGGQVEFKTDNRSLFDFSLAELELKGWELLACTYDLHADPALNEGNIMTEYEQRFSEEGVPICKYIARPKK